MLFTLTAPDFLKYPPAYNWGPLPLSYTASAATPASKPAPMGLQVVPSHFAMKLTCTPPTNRPVATINAGPEPSSKESISATGAESPAPSGLQAPLAYAMSETSPN